MTRQLLQLIITALAWAAGLGFLVGSILLVVAATAPRHAAPQGSARRAGDPAGQNAAPYSAAVGPGRAAITTSPAGPASGSAVGSPGYRVLAVFSGHGDGTTGHFHVRARRAWQLQWTYRCSATADATQFRLLRAGMAASKRAAVSTSIEEYAASGHGLASLQPVGQEYYLVVISDCTWRIKVVQAA